MAVMALCVQHPGAHLTSRDIEILEEGSLLPEASEGQWRTQDQDSGFPAGSPVYDLGVEDVSHYSSNTGICYGENPRPWGRSH